MLIPLSRRPGLAALFAIVDDGDFDALSRWHWGPQTGKTSPDQPYAARGTRAGGTRATILMHRQIMGLQPGDPLQVDHRDHNRLNNRRSNLRIVTRAEQQQNLPAMGGRSRFRGVSWDAKNRKWRATVVFEGRQHSCGRHDAEISAAKAAEAFRLAHMPFALPDPELAAAL